MARAGRGRLDQVVTRAGFDRRQRALERTLFRHANGDHVIAGTSNDMALLDALQPQP
jgi:hypothetical protein